MLQAKAILNTKIIVRLTMHIVYTYIALAAPYLELIEEMTAIEFLQFHLRLRLSQKVYFHTFLEQVNLEKAANKQIRYFQRV